MQDNVAADVREFLKRLYDFTKSVEDGLPSGDALPELIVQGFDEEQIWQELELQNEAWSSSLVASVASVVAYKDHLKFPVQRKSEERDSDNVGSGGEMQKHEQDDISCDGLSSAPEDETEMTADRRSSIRKQEGQFVCWISFCTHELVFCSSLVY